MGDASKQLDDKLADLETIMNRSWEKEAEENPKSPVASAPTVAATASNEAYISPTSSEEKESE